jgi:hypothetical protein
MQQRCTQCAAPSHEEKEIMSAPLNRTLPTLPCEVEENYVYGNTSVTRFGNLDR